MGLLKSTLFTEPPRRVSDALEQCAVRDAAHIKPGDRGEQVERIQIALTKLLKVFLEIDGICGPHTNTCINFCNRSRAEGNKCTQRRRLRRGLASPVERHL